MVNATNEHKQSVKRSLNGRCLPVGGSIGGARDATLLPPFNFLQFSCSFRQKCCKIIGFCPKIRGWRPLPSLGHPGPTTGLPIAHLAPLLTDQFFSIVNITMKQRKLSKYRLVRPLSHPLDPPYVRRPSDLVRKILNQPLLHYTFSAVNGRFPVGQ